MPMLSAVILSFLCAAAPVRGAEPALKTEDEKALYVLGVMLGRSAFPYNPAPAELDLILSGFRDGVGNRKPRVELGEYAPKLHDLEHARQASTVADMKVKAAVYLREAAKEPGAQLGPSGFVYFETRAGTGPAPGPNDVVRLAFTGYVLRDKKFETSSDKGVQTVYGMQEIFPCWKEGVLRMKAGGKARIVCPAELAYGEHGDPPDVPGGAALTYELELLEVKAQ